VVRSVGGASGRRAGQLPTGICCVRS